MYFMDLKLIAPLKRLNLIVETILLLFMWADKKNRRSRICDKKKKKSLGSVTKQHMFQCHSRR